MRTTTNADPVGSVWRRWDLHFHTPASYDYGNKSLGPADLAESLVLAGVQVIAVTDHHVIDVGFVSSLQVARPDGLTVLPGIEFRSELGGKEAMHYIGIFPEDVDIGALWISLQGQLMIAAGLAARGDDAFYVPFAKGCEVIHGLGGLVSVHAGRKSNSIEKLSNADVVKRCVKGDMARDHIDFFEVASADDCGGYIETVFPSLKIVLVCPPKSRPLKTSDSVDKIDQGFENEAQQVQRGAGGPDSGRGPVRQDGSRSL